MASPRIAVYSGTFDPFTLGHEDVVRRAAGLFDELIIAVAVAHHKKTLFSLEQRVRQVQQATQGLGRVKVLPFDGLIMDFCAHQGASAVVRGIRNTCSCCPTPSCSASAAPWCARSASSAAMSRRW